MDIDVHMHGESVNSAAMATQSDCTSGSSLSLTLGQLNIHVYGTSTINTFTAGDLEACDKVREDKDVYSRSISRSRDLS